MPVRLIFGVSPIQSRRTERWLIRARTTAALKAKRAKGQRAGNVPFGYRLDADRTTLVTDPQESATLTTLRRLRAEAGLSGATAETVLSIVETDDLDALEERHGSEAVSEHVGRLRRYFETLTDLGLRDFVRFDPTTKRDGACSRTMSRGSSRSRPTSAGTFAVGPVRRFWLRSMGR